MTVNGIDVSSYQDTVYTTAGLGFVFVKATEGTTYINPKHAAQVATGRARGLVVGHYHYAKPGPVDAQVAYFLRHAAPQAGDILAMDWEDTGVAAADKDSWLKRAQAAAPAHRVLLYCNRGFWLNRDNTSYCGDGLWIADPDSPAGHPGISHVWTIHQHAIAGGVDQDIADFADQAALKAWALKGAPRPKPRPRFEPFPGAGWFTPGRRSPIVTAMHERLVAVGCGRYRSHTGLDTIGAGDVASYQAWQHHFSSVHSKGWTGASLQWPPGPESWDALQVPHA
jgi:hypothetical protein